jgi:hypothetical protein
MATVKELCDQAEGVADELRRVLRQLTRAFERAEQQENWNQVQQCMRQVELVQYGLRLLGGGR